MVLISSTFFQSRWNTSISLGIINSQKAMSVQDDSDPSKFIAKMGELPRRAYNGIDLIVLLVNMYRATTGLS